MATLGSRLREARVAAGMSQNELARQLCVSRQAITKWENDKGVPDIANLKAMSDLFDVSVDYFVAGDEPVSAAVTRRPVGDLSSYPRVDGTRDKFDAAVRAFYPTAISIQPLTRYKKLNLWENVLDFITEPGVLQLADSLTNYSGNFIVDLGTHQLLVKVTSEVIESRELTTPFTGRRQQIGSEVFTKAPYRF